MTPRNAPQPPNALAQESFAAANKRKGKAPFVGQIVPAKPPTAKERAAQRASAEKLVKACEADGVAAQMLDRNGIAIVRIAPDPLPETVDEVADQVLDDIDSDVFDESQLAAISDAATRKLRDLEAMVKKERARLERLTGHKPSA